MFNNINVAASDITFSVHKIGLEKKYLSGTGIEVIWGRFHKASLDRSILIDKSNVCP